MSGSIGGRELWRRNVRRSAVAIVASNALAAVVVFAYLTWVVPLPSIDHPGRVTLLNLVVFTLYLGVAFPIGWVWSMRRVRPIRDWMAAGREPTPGERDLALRAPLHQLAILAAGWGGAALLFLAVNLAISFAMAVEISATIVLGGVVTSALGYLLIERINRATTALALAIGPPLRPAGPGVSTRMLLAWAIGTSVFLLGCGVRKLGRPSKPSDLQRDRIYAPHRRELVRDRGRKLLAGASPGMEEEEGSDHGNRGGQEHQLPGDAEDEHREHSHKDERKAHTVRGPCWPRRALLGEGVAAASATRRTLSYSPLTAGARFLRHRSED